MTTRIHMNWAEDNDDNLDLASHNNGIGVDVEDDDDDINSHGCGDDAVGAGVVSPSLANFIHEVNQTYNETRANIFEEDTIMNASNVALQDGILGGEQHTTISEDDDNDDDCRMMTMPTEDVENRRLKQELLKHDATPENTHRGTGHDNNNNVIVNGHGDDDDYDDYDEDGCGGIADVNPVSRMSDSEVKRTALGVGLEQLQQQQQRQLFGDALTHELDQFSNDATNLMTLQMEEEVIVLVDEEVQDIEVEAREAALTSKQHPSWDEDDIRMVRSDPTPPSPRQQQQSPTGAKPSGSPSARGVTAGNSTAITSSRSSDRGIPTMTARGASIGRINAGSRSISTPRIQSKLKQTTTTTTIKTSSSNKKDGGTPKAAAATSTLSRVKAASPSLSAASSTTSSPRSRSLFDRLSRPTASSSGRSSAAKNRTSLLPRSPASTGSSPRSGVSKTSPAVSSAKSSPSKASPDAQKGTIPATPSSRSPPIGGPSKKPKPSPPSSANTSPALATAAVGRTGVSAVSSSLRASSSVRRSPQSVSPQRAAVAARTKRIVAAAKRKQSAQPEAESRKDPSLSISTLSDGKSLSFEVIDSKGAATAAVDQVAANGTACGTGQSEAMTDSAAKMTNLHFCQEVTKQGKASANNPTVSEQSTTQTHSLETGAQPPSQELTKESGEMVAKSDPRLTSVTKIEVKEEGDDEDPDSRCSTPSPLSMSSCNAPKPSARGRAEAKASIPTSRPGRAGKASVGSSAVDRLSRPTAAAKIRVDLSASRKPVPRPGPRSLAKASVAKSRSEQQPEVTTATAVDDSCQPAEDSSAQGKGVHEGKMLSSSNRISKVTAAAQTRRLRAREASASTSKPAISSRLLQDTKASQSHRLSRTQAGSSPSRTRFSTKEAMARAGERIRRKRLQKAVKEEERPRSRLDIVRSSPPVKSQRKPTVPITPNFATSKRLGQKVVPSEQGSTPGQAVDVLRKGIRDSGPPARSRSTSRSATIPIGPRLATAARSVEKSKHHLESTGVSGADQTFESGGSIARLFGDKSMPGDSVHWKDQHSLAHSTDILRGALRHSTPLLPNRPPGLTVPVGPKFQKIKSRAPPKSTAEKEAEMMEYYSSHPFKASPVTRSLKEAPKAVKKPSRRSSTVPQPFKLHNSSHVGARLSKGTSSPSENATDTGYRFRARPLPKFVADAKAKASGSSPRSTDEATFKEGEQKLSFKARPVPKSTYTAEKFSPSPSKRTEKLSPSLAPSLSTSARAEHRMVVAEEYERKAESFVQKRQKDAETRRREKQEQTIQEAAAAIGSMVACDGTIKSSDEASPFRLRSAIRHEAYEMKFDIKIREERAAEKEQRNFHAKPFHMPKAPSPIIPAKKHTNPEPFHFQTDTRHEDTVRAIAEQQEEWEQRRIEEANFKATPLPETTYVPRPVISPLKAQTAAASASSGTGNRSEGSEVVEIMDDDDDGSGSNDNDERES